MKLHQNKTLFEQAVRVTAQQKQLPEIFVEKDYWVMVALKGIFSSELKDEVVFKGGTSLSKCFGYIERFSEDIDLVLLFQDSDSGNSLKKKLKTISSIVAFEMEEVEIKDLTNKKGKIRKTAHAYLKSFKGDFGQVRDNIILESSYLGYFEPYQKSLVNTFVYEMMLQSDQQDLIAEYEMEPFEILVLDPRRTICEKIMSLARFSNTKKPIADLKKKVRHIYDIHQLLQIAELRDYFNHSDFEKLLIKVAIDDIESFKNNNEWLKKHLLDNLVYQDFPTVWKELETEYLGGFKQMVYGELPGSESILNTFDKVITRLKDINWEPVEKQFES
jgi:hypothetical protein